MKNFYLTLLVSLITVINLFAQPAAVVDTSWKKGGFIALTFSQTNLSNWAQGGENSLALSSTANLFANYLKGKADFQNSLDMAYSFVKTGTDGIIKSDDKIDFTSKYGRKFAEKWLWSVLLNFKSQFADGYNYPDDSIIVSKFFSPAYITLAPGITYKPIDYFEVFISPATAKWTFVQDQFLSDAGAYGVDPGETMRTELGAYLNMRFKKDVLENVNVYSKLELFNNYTDDENPTNIDVNWDTSINMKVNKWITASIRIEVIYDADVIARTQFKESVGVGFGYKF